MWACATKPKKILIFHFFHFSCFEHFTQEKGKLRKK